MGTDLLMIATIQAAQGVTDLLKQIFAEAIEQAETKPLTASVGGFHVKIFLSLQAANNADYKKFLQS